MDRPPHCLSHATPNVVRSALKESQASGDYLEFGVYEGATLIAAYKAVVDLELSDTRIVGFDSFRGLPRPRGVDANWQFHKGQYACDAATVRSLLESEGVPRDAVTLVEGFYSRTLIAKTRQRFRGVRVALIDCDLYASTVRVLRFLNPLLAPGSLLLFDDWNCFDGDPERGQRRAFAEFAARTSLSFAEGEEISDHGQVLMVT